MFGTYQGVTVVNRETQDNINWISDLLVKGLVGAATILLGIAVNSLNAMNGEIKELAQSVNTLTVSSTVVLEAQKVVEKRLDKIELSQEKIQSKIREQDLRLVVIENLRKKR